MAGNPDFSCDDLNGKDIHFYLTENQVYPEVLNFPDTLSIGDLIFKYTYNSGGTAPRSSTIDDIAVVYDDRYTLSFAEGLKQQIKGDITLKWEAY